jgi:hypothetical protein
MANIKVKDLSAYNESGSFIRDLSDAELELQGGGLFSVLKKVVKAIGSIFKAVDDIIDIFSGSGGSSERNGNVKLH